MMLKAKQKIENKILELDAKEIQVDKSLKLLEEKHKALINKYCSCWFGFKYKRQANKVLKAHANILYYSSAIYFSKLGLRLALRYIEHSND